MRKGGDYYRDVMAKVEALCYGEPRRNHTVLYEGKKPLVSIRKPDDGQMPINIRNSKS